MSKLIHLFTVVPVAGRWRAYCAPPCSHVARGINRADAEEQLVDHWMAEHHGGTEEESQ